jgi:hypothetical protein
MSEAVSVARAWQQAANEQDVDRLLALSAPGIELIGPRGGGRGHELLRAWLGRAGLALTTRRLFAGGPHVVAEQHGLWRDPGTGAVVGEAEVATWFRVADGRVDLLARYDTLAEALASAGLAEDDAVVEDADHG